MVLICILILIVMNTRDKMNVYFGQEKLCSYSEASITSDAFGPFNEIGRVGRQTQSNEAWDSILTYSEMSRVKCPALFLHGSPGLGKTDLLRELYYKKMVIFHPREPKL